MRSCQASRARRAARSERSRAGAAPGGHGPRAPPRARASRDRGRRARPSRRPPRRPRPAAPCPARTAARRTSRRSCARACRGRRSCRRCVRAPRPHRAPAAPGPPARSPRRRARRAGGGSGIGRACALRFADEDAKVTVSDLDLEGATATASEIQGHAIRADVGQEQDIRDLIAQAEDRQGPIDAFFSNAGITGPPGGPPDLLDEDWDLLWRVNVMSHVWAARALLPKMLEREEGYLLSTASAAGLLTQLGALGYATTKHAAVAVAEWLDITYRDRGIRVSCLCPQFVNTPMVTEGLDVDKLRQIATIIEPEQVADDVVAAMREERFLILPHPEVGKYMRNRGSDHPRWLAGMRQLQAHLGGLERPPQ